MSGHSALQADRSGKVLVDKLRSTIKVCLPHCMAQVMPCSTHQCTAEIVQEFELTIDLDTLLAELDKEQTGSIDYKEFKSILD